MDLERHDFQLDDLVDRLQAQDHRLVALQIPEGLKMQALEMIDEIESRSGAQVVLAGDPCYGACDLVHSKMQQMGVSLVAHMGHSQMNIDSGMETEFIHVTYGGDPELEPILPILERHAALARRAADPDAIVESQPPVALTPPESSSAEHDGTAVPLTMAADVLDTILPTPGTGTAVGLVGSIQHLHILEDIKARLEAAGYPTIIPTGGDRLTFPGQVLGCNYSGDNEEIGHYLFLGSGDFHPIGLVLDTGKPVAVLDPYSGEARALALDGIDRLLRQRFGLIMQTVDLQRFGILIGEKPGQMRRALALRIKRQLEAKGRTGYLIALDHVSPDLIDFYPVEAFVNTACPRIAIDDSVRYAKPLITPFELDVALGERSWDDGYQFDEIP